MYVLKEFNGKYYKFSVVFRVDYEYRNISSMVPAAVDDNDVLAYGMNLFAIFLHDVSSTHPSHPSSYLICFAAVVVLCFVVWYGIGLVTVDRVSACAVFYRRPPLFSCSAQRLRDNPPQHVHVFRSAVHCCRAVEQLSACVSVVVGFVAAVATSAACCVGFGFAWLFKPYTRTRISV